MELTDQSALLSGSKLFMVLACLSLALLTSFIDTNAVGIALPTIGADLKSSDTISWVGTSGLIANAVFQVLYGRLSDIFGRKAVFLSAIVLLVLGDVACGFAQTGTQLYVFRGITGVGNGGIAALSMVILSDIVSLRDRGKYQGILGANVGLGNTIGPFLSAAVIQKATWRAVFWIISPLAFICGITIFFFLPQSPPMGKTREKLNMIDYYGVMTSMAATLLLLIPLAGGGTYFPWSSPMVISMLTLGGLSAIAFIVIEWKFASLPMMPLHLFRIPAVAAIVAQNFLFGMVYYSALYYLPIYYQEVRQFTPIVSAALTVPIVVSQSVASIISGQYISRTGRYGEVVWLGFFLWTLGAGLHMVLNRATHPAVIVIILVIEGVGVGNVFQPTLVAIQAHSSKEDRAVVISVRNYSRSLGGAAGLAISSAVYSNALQAAARASSGISLSNLQIIMTSTFKTPNLGRLSAAEKGAVLDVYMAASRTVFIVWIPMMAVCLMLCFLVKDRGLQRREEQQISATPSLSGKEETTLEGPASGLEKASKTTNDSKEVYMVGIGMPLHECKKACV